MFRMALREEIIKSQKNNFGSENFDEYRFGKMVATSEPPNDLLFLVKQVIKKVIGLEKTQRDKAMNAVLEGSFNALEKYADDLELLYFSVGQESKDLIVKIIAFRLLGYSKVKLPSNNSRYWEALSLAKNLKCGHEHYDPHFMHFVLEKFDLSQIGYDIKLFFSDGGIAIDFIIEQYAYKMNGQVIVQADNGDVVLDIGGCWGDTALYFSHKVGETGMVYSFEFIPDNIKLFKINTEFNKKLNQRIVLVPNPVSNVSDLPVYFKDNGPGSKIESTPFGGQTGSTLILKY